MRPRSRSLERRRPRVVAALEVKDMYRNGAGSLAHRIRSLACVWNSRGVAVLVPGGWPGTNGIRLLKAVSHHTRDSLHTKLAEVYTLNKQYDEALESFHFAIRYGMVGWRDGSYGTSSPDRFVLPSS